MTERTNPIVRFAVERRVTMGMGVLGVLVLGWLSLLRLPLEFMPSFSSSRISIQAPYRSSSPEEIERILVRPLEDILGTINGIDTLTARAAADSATVNLEFVDGIDMDLAAVEVRDRIDRVRHLLPDDLERVFIRRRQSTDIPVMRINLSADWEPDRLYRFVEDVLQRRVERLEGVANVDVRGLQLRQLQILLNPARMEAHAVDVRELVTLLNANNLTISGGVIREASRKLLVRITGEFRTPDEIRRLPLNTTGLRLGDIAEVELAYPRREDFDYLNGAGALSLNVYKTSNANLLAVSDEVRAEIEAVRQLPEAAGLDLRYYHDGSLDVRKGLGELRNTGLIGGVLAIAFMFFFLRRLRTTLLVAFAIPISVVVTFVIMYLSRQLGAAELSINLMSLMGLMLAIGMLVDNSIVVVESIFRHRQDLGEDARTATLRGASEVALPIFASTVTTICVFVPMMFLASGGRFAVFMRHIGTTVCIVMVASLIVSLTVVPMAAPLMLRGESRKRQLLLDRLIGGYGATLRFTLRHRFFFSLLILGMLGGSWILYQQIERSFTTPSFQRRITLLLDVPKHYSLAQKEALYTELYELFDGHREELEIADISYSFKRGAGRSHGYHGTNRFEIFLVDEEQSRLNTAEIRDRVEELLPPKAGVSVKIARSMRGRSRHGSGLEVELVGEELEILERLSQGVLARLESIPMLRDVDSSLESGDEEIHVEVDRERALQAGLSSQGVARSISSALSSRAVSYFKTEDREIDLVVQYREQDRRTLDQLKKLPVSVGGAALPISSLAHFEIESGPRTIERENRRAKIEITADTVGNASTFALMRPLQSALGSLNFPVGYEWNTTGGAREAEQETAEALFTLLFALLLIYMIMASLFEHFAQPLTIMFAVPFAFIGVGVIMKLAEQPRSRASDMGLIILAGIVVNNAIVLIDHINRLRRQGMQRDAAIVLGGQHRLRPILMTAATTILGLSPMVAPFFFPALFGPPEGRAAFWAPVGLVILGGLTTSTFLTLVVIPTVYSLVDDLTRSLKRVVAAV
ncbi:MAG: efflux RND transporter permease subunit [bacterium]|nr:efflux RND transporter permease subunit [bacterium]